MLPTQTLELVRAIDRLKATAQQVLALSENLPVAEKNAYMILSQIEMLEIEICDPVAVLAVSDKQREERKDHGTGNG